jgi:hypothetical protein
VLYGIPYGFLWSADAFLNPQTWNLEITYWKITALRDKCVEFMQTLDQYLQILKNSLRNRQVEDEELLHLHSPFGNRIETSDYPIATHLKQIRYIILKSFDSTTAIEAPEPNDVWAEDCIFCNGTTSMIKKKLFQKISERLCKVCSRAVFLLTQYEGSKKLNAPSSELICLGHNPLTIHFNGYFSSETISHNDVWFPKIESLCQEVCLRLIHPDTGVVPLSTKALDCLLSSQNSIYGPLKKYRSNGRTLG